MAARTAICLFGLPALFLAAFPQLAPAFVFDRNAIAAGELWRLWTGHWVHFSSSHLWWNLAALTPIGTWLETERPGLLLRFSIIGAPLLSLGLWFLDPHMLTYGGLSGLGTGVVTLLGLTLCQNHGKTTTTGAIILTLVTLKLGSDITSGTAMLSTFSEPEIRPASPAHLLGTLLALISFSTGRSALARDSSASRPQLHLNPVSAGNASRRWPSPRP